MSDGSSPLLENNRRWAASMLASDPQFFERLARQQTPRYLWIGCADSRVPSNQIVDLPPGDVFVHRNVANQVVPSDLNMLSVVQYAVEVLGVQQVIVAGHYGCGGVVAATRRERHGLVDNWLHPIRDLVKRHQELLRAQPDEKQIIARMCELNVIAQVENVARTTIASDAWDRGATLEIHGWIYGLHDGILRDLGVTITCGEEVDRIVERAIAALASP